jgi:hypothetical protein
MKRITKSFDTLRAAERYQNRLYGRHFSVRLVHAPHFTESGIYTWEVA